MNHGNSQTFRKNPFWLNIFFSLKNYNKRSIAKLLSHTLPVTLLHSCDIVQVQSNFIYILYLIFMIILKFKKDTFYIVCFIFYTKVMKKFMSKGYLHLCVLFSS